MLAIIIVIGIVVLALFALQHYGAFKSLEAHNKNGIAAITAIVNKPTVPPAPVTPPAPVVPPAPIAPIAPPLTSTSVH